MTDAMAEFSSRPPLGRRGFMTGLAGAGLALSLPRGARAQAKTPVRGGALSVVFAGAVDTLDPHKMLSAQGQQFSFAVFEALTELDDNNMPAPRLATAWTAEKGGLEWVFTLRQGVKFHDGGDFTSADVVATIERSFDDSLGLRSKDAFGPVKAVRAEGPHAVRLIMSQPCAETPALVANGWAMIVSAKNMKSLESNPIGTGPFRFKSFEPGASATVVRNENYWLPGVPYLDSVRIVAISQSVAQQAALRSGDVQIVEFLSADSYLTLSRTKGVKAWSLPVGQYHTLAMNGKLAPFDKPKVREAFRYLMDRDTLLASALLGQGTLGNDVALFKSSPYYKPLPQNKQDLPKARKLLEEAGVASLNLEVYTTSDRPPSPKMAVALQQGAAQIGVNLTIRDVPYSEYVSSVSRKKHLYTSQWNERPTLFEVLYQNYHSKASFSLSGIELADGLDSLLEQMIAELDADRRKALAGQAMEKIHQYSDRIIPYFMNYMSATHERVEGYTPPRTGPSDLRKVWLSA